MKNVCKLVFIFLILVLSACDEIDNPILASGNTYREDLYGPAPEFQTLPDDEIFKRALIEDFTGHHCGNCPPAHVAAADILAAQGEEKVSVIAVHVTGLAEPISDGIYTADYRTTEGDLFWKPFEGAFGIPLGRVNRAGGNGNPWTQSMWAGETANQLAQTPKVAVQISTNYVTESNDLNIHVHTEVLENIDNDCNLVVLITESHIVSPQLWYGQVPEETIMEYEHNHMLRTSISGAFGLQLFASPQQGDEIVKSYTYGWNSNWEIENCHIVAFVVDNATTEILNSAEVNIIE